MHELQTIALIGQPNVGKSSLFNRLLNKRVAIVSNISGTTRDIRKKEIEIFDRSALLLDTGGIDETDDVIFSNVKAKAIIAAKDADIVLFLVDGKNIPNNKDKVLYYQLQKLGKKLALVVNKIDNDKELERLWEFFEFGIDKENLFGISVSHNRGTKSLIEWIYNHLQENPTTIKKFEEEQKQFEEDFEYIENEGFLIQNLEEMENKKIDDSLINVAIIGKVNVGKSSILNALLGKERSVVSNIAGTTIDPVDETYEYKNKKITFVDTAGLRRRGSIEGIEKFALIRTKEMLELANIALVVLDASKQMSDLDEKIAGLVDEYGLGTIIVLNKWDENISSFEKTKEEIRRRFRFLSYAPIIVISAKTKRGIEKLKDKIIEIFENYTQRITTSSLNKVIEEAVIKHSLPSPNGVYLRIYYATQFSSRPPRVALVMNKPQLLHYSYKRYLVNFLREQFNFEGTPIHIIARGKSDKINDKEYLDK